MVMRRNHLILIGAVLLISVPPEPIRADSPLPPPTRQTIWSANRQFFAVTDPDSQVTTVYRAKGTGGERLWAMYGWFGVAALADDGDHLVAGYRGMNLIPVNYNKKEVMLYFFRRGELLNHVSLDQIIGDFSRLRRTASHYFWGNFVGFDRDGLYVVSTVEGRRLRFDVTKGMPVPEPDDVSRPGKAVTSDR
jgi:hypothetical protein